VCSSTITSDPAEGQQEQQLVGSNESRNFDSDNLQTPSQGVFWYTHYIILKDTYNNLYFHFSQSEQAVEVIEVKIIFSN